MLDSTISLNDMEKKLEHIVQRNKGKIRTLKDFQLTNEDYKILCLRLRGFSKYQRDIKLYEKYRLSLLCAGAYAFLYEANIQNAIKKVDTVFESIPQYMKRKVFDICEIALEENDFTMYGLHIVDVLSFEQALIIQAGFPEEITQNILKLCDAGSDMTMKELIASVNWKEYKLKLDILDDILKGRVFKSITEAYIDCREHSLTKREMSEKYQELSYSYITSCVHFCNQENYKEEQKLVK